MLKVGESYKSQAGRVRINNQFAPDANNYSFIGSVPGGASVLYKADGYCEPEEYRIVGPWIEDGVIYQPIDTAPTVLGERYMDLDKLKQVHPGKYIAKLQLVNGVPTLSVEAP